LLSLEAATLRQADRVEAVARGSLDMELPDATRVINVGERTRTASAEGAR
jgi:cell division protein FtsL